MQAGLFPRAQLFTPCLTSWQALQNFLSFAMCSLNSCKNQFACSISSIYRFQLPSTQAQARFGAFRATWPCTITQLHHKCRTVKLQNQSLTQQLSCTFWRFLSPGTHVKFVVCADFKVVFTCLQLVDCSCIRARCDADQSLADNNGHALTRCVHYSQCVASALYCTGFAESVTKTFNWNNAWAVRGVAIGTLVLLLAINLAGWWRCAVFCCFGNYWKALCSDLN